MMQGSLRDEYICGKLKALLSEKEWVSLVLDRGFSKVTVTESREAAAMHEESAVLASALHVFAPSSLSPCPWVSVPDKCMDDGKW
jgi:hypothetical protein